MTNQIPTTAAPFPYPETILYSKLDQLAEFLKEPSIDMESLFLVGCLASLDRMLTLTGEVCQ